MPTAPPLHKPAQFGTGKRDTSDRGQWSHMYNCTAWRKLRLRQLIKEPLCRLCESKGRVTAATVCDHIEAHKGDPAKFWQGPFQSLCAKCHNSDKQRMDKRAINERPDSKA